MRCREIRKKTILFLYGELSPREKSSFKQHVDKCSKCRQKIAESSRVFEILTHASPEEREPDWEKCWEKIESGLEHKPAEKEKHAFFFPRWAYAGAAFLLVFILGIGLGLLLQQRKEAPFSSASSIETGYGVESRGLQVALRNHIETLKPIIIDYKNTDFTQKGQKISVERELLRELLLQNYLLKKAIAEANPAAVPLLEDLDLILKELSNRKNYNGADNYLVKELIEERRVLFKMQVLSNT